MSAAGGTGDRRAYQREFYDRHYPKRQAAVAEQLAHPLFRSFYDRLAGRVLDLALEGREASAGPLRVLEPGCGEGLLGSALHRAAGARRLVLDYVASDLSRAALELARPHVPGDLRVGDATEVTASMARASQDLVVVKNLLHHLDDPAGFLRAARRALGPGGRVVAVEPSLGCPQFLLFNVLAARRERHYFAGQRRNGAAFEAAGLSVLHRERFSWLPYELAFVIRFGVFRRLFSSDDPATIRRVSELDDRLTARVPAMSCYVIWVGAADGTAGPSAGVTKNT